MTSCFVKGETTTDGVGDEREGLRVPRVQPEIVLGQIDAAFVANLDHEMKYAQKRRNETAGVEAGVLTRGNVIHCGCGQPPLEIAR